VSAEWPLALPERLTGPDLKAGLAKKGGSNVAAVRTPLRRGRGSAMLSVPGWPKRQSWSKQKHCRGARSGSVSFSEALSSA